MSSKFNAHEFLAYVMAGTDKRTMLRDVYERHDLEDRQRLGLIWALLRWYDDQDPDAAEHLIGIACLVDGVRS